MPKFPFFIFAFLLLLFPNINAQDFSKVEIEAVKVTEHIYMLTGRGGNIGLFIGKDGAFLIDDQFAPLSGKILTKVKSLTDKPIRYLANTHWHGDHTGGNENMSNEGITIIAHENVRERMRKGQVIQAFNRTVPPAPEAALPVITFSEEMNLYLNGENILITHVHNAHTDGDAFIYFTQSNVLHMGDNFFNGRYPYIDLSSGGSIDGLIKGVNTALFIADSDTKIIPGHGQLGTKEDLKKYRDVLIDIRDRVAKAIKSGMELEEIKAANVTKEYDEEWGQAFINPERIVDIIHTSLTKEESK